MSKLTITGYSDPKFTQKAAKPNQYVAMLNPENIQLGYSIEYSSSDSGTSDQGPKFKQILSETLNFELVIDCTGVVDDKKLDLKKQLDELCAVVYDYKSDKHRTNFVTVVWGGTLNFKGVLTSMSVSYTFFKPDGTALRARVKLDFKSYIDPKTLAKEQNQKSPDVTHRVLVREGDSLPLIADRIYQDPDYFVALAQANRLDKFRHLVAGSQLLTPPLKSTGEAHG